MRPSIAIVCALSLALSVALTACGGWRLQGQIALPPALQPLSITADRADHRLLSDMEEMLERNKVSLAGRGDAAANLHLFELAEGSRVLSISSDGRPAESEIYALARFSLSSGEEVLIEEQEIVRTRTVAWSETDILAQQEEREVLGQALREDLVRTLMQRIASAARTGPPEPEAGDAAGDDPGDDDRVHGSTEGDASPDESDTPQSPPPH